MRITDMSRKRLAAALLVAWLVAAGMAQAVAAQDSDACGETLANRLWRSLPVGGWVGNHNELPGTEWAAQLSVGNDLDAWRGSALQLLADQMGASLEEIRFLTAVVDVPDVGLGEITAVRACDTNSDGLLLLARPLFSDLPQGDVVALGPTAGWMTWIDRATGLESLAFRDGDTVYVGGSTDPVMRHLVNSIALEAAAAS